MPEPRWRTLVEIASRQFCVHVADGNIRQAKIWGEVALAIAYTQHRPDPVRHAFLDELANAILDPEDVARGRAGAQLCPGCGKAVNSDGAGGRLRAWCSARCRRATSARQRAEQRARLNA